MLFTNVFESQRCLLNEEHQRVVESIRLFNDENPGGVQSANAQKGALNKRFSSIVSYLVIRSPISANILLDHW